MTDLPEDLSKDHRREYVNRSTPMNDAPALHCIPTAEIKRIRHDLKNPLSTIKILVEVVQRRLPNEIDPELKALLRNIDSTCDSFSQLIDTELARLIDFPALQHTERT